MPYKVGLVGLPNAGKSTLFKFLARQNVLIANYPFATIEPNIGNMILVDHRLWKLQEYWKSKVVPSTVQIIDIAGLIRGAAKGMGLGNEFLSHIRSVDLVCQVVRCFLDSEIIHIEKTVDPVRDYHIVQLELILSDIEQIDRRINKLKRNDTSKSVLEQIKFNLEQGITNQDQNLINCNLLTSKPVLMVANYSGEKKELLQLQKYSQEARVSMFPLAVKIEEELNVLSEAEKNELGLKSNCLEIFSAQIKEILELKVFFTVGKDEIKSWLAKKEWTARQCSKLIHSDIQKNFVCVEVYHYLDWQTTSEEQLRKLGKIRKEGAGYVIQDGDICFFLFGKNRR